MDVRLYAILVYELFVQLRESVSNLDDLHTNLAVSNIGQGSSTPLKDRVQNWVKIFIAVQS